MRRIQIPGAGHFEIASPLSFTWPQVKSGIESLLDGKVVGAFGVAVDTKPSAHSSSPAFQKIQVTDKFWAEGAAAGDLDRDGYNDVVAGPYWYAGPDFKKRYSIFPATQSFKVTSKDGVERTIEGYEGALGQKNGYSETSLVYTRDFNQDGWLDVMVIGFPGKEATWYENPGRDLVANTAQWRPHIAYDVVTNESPGLVDLLGNGRPVLLCMTDNHIGYVAPDARNPQNQWTFHRVSGELPILRDLRARLGKPFGYKPFPFVHGLGAGDVDGDGRQDVLEPDGWWQQPASLSGDPVWTFHKWPFLQDRSAFMAKLASTEPLAGDEMDTITKYSKWPYTMAGAQMYAYDVNGDGRPDVISSLDAHGYGLAWFEQVPSKSAQGEIQFKPHFIMPAGRDASASVNFTQLHAVDLVDMDGDGLKGIVTGKRFWAHGPDGPDPETNAPAVLYWFKLTRIGDGRAEFVPHLIDDDSGVGTQVVATDVNKDGRPDVVVGSKKGVFVLLQKASSANRETMRTKRRP